MALRTDILADRPLHKDDVSSIRRDIQDIQGKFQSLSSLVTQSKKDIEEKVARGLTSVTRGLEVVQKDLGAVQLELRNEVAAREAGLGQLSTRIHETLAKAAAKLKEELTALQIDISSSKSTNMSDVRTEMELLKKKLSKEDLRISNEVGRISSCLNEVSAMARKREAELSEDFSSFASKMSTLASSAVSSSELKQEIARIEGALHDGPSGELAQCFKDLQARINTLDDEVLENVRKVALLEQSKAGMSEHTIPDASKDTTELTLIAASIEKLQSESSSLHEELIPWRERDEEIRVQTSEVSASVARLDARIDTVHESIYRLEMQTNSVNRESGSPGDSTLNAQLTRCCQDLQARLNDLGNEVLQHSNKLTSLERTSKLDASSRSAISAPDVGRDGDADVSRLVAEIESLQGQCDGIREELFQVRERDDRGRAQVDQKVQSRIDALLQVSEKVQSRMDALSQKCDGVSRENSRTKEYVGVQQKLKEAEIVQLREHLDGMSKKYDARCYELCTLSGQLKSSKAEMRAQGSTDKANQVRLDELHAEFQASDLRAKTLRSELSQKMDGAAAQRQLDMIRREVDAISRHVSRVAGDLQTCVTTEEMQRSQTSALSRAHDDICVAVERLVDERLTPVGNELQAMELDRREFLSRCESEYSEMSEILKKSRHHEDPASKVKSVLTNPVPIPMQIHRRDDASSALLRSSPPNSEQYLLSERNIDSTVSSAIPVSSLIRSDGIALAGKHDVIQFQRWVPRSGEVWALSGNVQSVSVFSTADGVVPHSDISSFAADRSLRQFEVLTTPESGDLRVHFRNLQGCSLLEGWLPMFDERGHLNIGKCDGLSETPSDCTFA